MARSITEKLSNYDLFEMTRTDGIENHFDAMHLTSNKEIAAQVRKHLKERFPMCKWSVTSDLYSVCVYLKAAPYDRESDEVFAIAHYAMKYTQSYNFDGFRGTYSEYSIYFGSEQTEMSVAEREVAERFQASKRADDKAKEEEQEKQMEEQMKKAEEEHAQAKERAKVRKANNERLTAVADVRDVADYFVLDCLDKQDSKQDYIEDYFESEKSNRIDCKVSREVRFSKEDYELFTHMLLDDFDFLAGFGGSKTDDDRIQSMEDYYQMDADERKTVKWYSTDCVAVFCDGECKIIVDPQGYNYARYVYFVDDVSLVSDECCKGYEIPPAIRSDNRKLAEKLEEISADVIIHNDLFGDWDRGMYHEYERLLLDEMCKYNFPFTVDVIREIKIENLKTAMYKLYREINKLQAQFDNAGFTENQKITVIRMTDMGGMGLKRGYYRRHENGHIEKYEDSVKLIIRPENEKKDYYIWLFDDTLVLDGWYNVPEDVLYNVSVGDSGCKIREGKFSSFDKTQYDAILEYFENQGVVPIVNTYNPELRKSMV